MGSIVLFPRLLSPIYYFPYKSYWDALDAKREMELEKKKRIAKANIKAKREQQAKDSDKNKARLKSEYGYTDLLLFKMTPWLAAEELERLDKTPNRPTASFRTASNDIDPYADAKAKIHEEQLEASKLLKVAELANEALGYIPVVGSLLQGMNQGNVVTYNLLLGNKQAAREAKIEAAKNAVEGVAETAFWVAAPWEMAASKAGEYLGGEIGEAIGGEEGRSWGENIGGLGGFFMPSGARRAWNWATNRFEPVRNWAAGLELKYMSYAEEAPQVTSQGRFLKSWKNGEGANISERFGIEGHPEKGYFELVYDNEPGFHSVHFKTPMPWEENALTAAEKEALFANLAALIPEGGYVSTWAPEGSSGISKGGRSGLNRFGELGFDLVGTRPALYRETGEIGKIPIWRKPVTSSTLEQIENDYNLAVASGDLEKALLLRDLHFRLVSGNDTLVFAHSTPNNFTVFDKNFFGNTDEGFNGKGFYFSTTRIPDPENLHLFKIPLGPHGEVPTMNYGKNKMYVYLKGNREYNIGNPNRNFFEEPNTVGFTASNPSAKVSEVLVGLPEQIKSANAITYDDLGNIIPLSLRDDFTNPDIRYSTLSGLNWTDTLPTNNIRETDGVIRTQLPGFRGYKFVFDKNTGKFDLTIDNIGLDNLSKNGLISLAYPTQLTEELAARFLNNEFELFNETAHPFQKAVYKYYDDLPKVEVNESGQWSNYKELIDKTPEELRTILEKRWNYLNDNLHRTPDYAERVVDAVEEYNKTAPIKLDAGEVLERILNDASETTTPIVYRHNISNGGVSFPTTLYRPWGVNATTVSSTIDKTIIHEMEHILYGSSGNDIAKINHAILNSEGGLTANRTEAFAKLSPERLKYLGDRDEFFAHIKEGVDAIIRLGKSMELVMEIPSIKELATVYKSDFVKKMLQKLLIASGMITGGASIMSNGTSSN